jgi:hypothetical protein
MNSNLLIRVFSIVAGVLVLASARAQVTPQYSSWAQSFGVDGTDDVAGVAPMPDGGAVRCSGARVARGIQGVVARERNPIPRIRQGSIRGRHGRRYNARNQLATDTAASTKKFQNS